MEHQSRVRRHVLLQEHDDPGQGETCNGHAGAASVARTHDNVLSMADASANLKIEVSGHRGQHCQTSLDVERMVGDKMACDSDLGGD